jgi:hypothetical protein
LKGQSPLEAAMTKDRFQQPGGILSRIACGILG